MAVYILSGARTPSGSFMGALSSVPAPRLGAVAIKGALANAQISGDKVGEVFMGNVIQTGEGQAPARQAALFAELPESVPCTTVNKVCGSGMKTIIMGAQSILAGDNNLVVAGGMENMSMIPHFVGGSRSGTKFGHIEMKDTLLHDGLWDVYTNRAMGNCAEECVTKFNFSRQAQDAFAIESFKRAQQAMKEGIFKKEIVPVTIKGKAGDVVISEDEGPMTAKFDKIPALKPAFDKNGSITAANASTINDGASAVVLGGEEYRSKAKFKIVAYAGHAQNPTWFTTAPAAAMKKCLEKAHLKLSDIDLFEINEAFACVTMAAMTELALDHSKVNIYGGGVSLGHPIGNSGTRIVVTLMNAMEQKKSKYGMASICIGGGEALSLILERL
ncbi:MAG: acetyl-CoA acetyltransferase [Bdellovibrionales bacterium RIFOXYD12_FULL_39_22]|nr:MAG: acetyl-CoA acetyltransferase [Bdellovibrionales bacterium RIFOXYB1_FULL_39_21]OFZ44458.1 MAG: acetyl-CoA acetyltransferase [Bdellovibrionales bacterium RIFOXYC12_FULL_39_17]OFZ49900.1 MAG: acetyl-CoA acetyltransferase [Bdellovibrionales bacterium RIFOXYC1_FULL_39_130]OFZ69468.1 MAG: acetyl-CoA acetyltransferase [Bdellovibrionales bacterium RIFOXYC2_FULL_39_8]OFZ76905.1 MAG: acetyl-CoA acetyltransferase [Bdellovibrionales bacterium RIFOXYD1_FULL_39_84]OFZ95832.1 MAG: acetyl-CoA acetyltr